MECPLQTALVLQWGVDLVLGSLCNLHYELEAVCVLWRAHERTPLSKNILAHWVKEEFIDILESNPRQYWQINWFSSSMEWYQYLRESSWIERCMNLSYSYSQSSSSSEFGFKVLHLSDYHPQEGIIILWAAIVLYKSIYQNSLGHASEVFFLKPLRRLSYVICTSSGR